MDFVSDNHLSMASEKSGPNKSLVIRTSLSRPFGQTHELTQPGMQPEMKNRSSTTLREERPASRCLELSMCDVLNQHVGGERPTDMLSHTPLNHAS